MNDPLRYDTYVPLLNATFTIGYGEDGTIEARLVEVSPLVERGTSVYFSLLFLTEPLDGAAQGLYRLEHPEIESVELLFVPVGRAPDGAVQLETVINTMRNVGDQA